MTAWLDRMWWYLSGASGATAGQRILLIALVACSLFASGQLLTMLGTRWGDRHAMAKSFVLSIIVHLCLGLGWATAVRDVPVPPPSFPAEAEAPIPIKAVLTAEDERVSQPEPGDIPIWRQPLSVPSPLVSRTSRDAAPVDSIPQPQSELPRSTPAPLPDLSVSTAAAEPETAPEVEAPAQVPTPATPAVASADNAPAAEAMARPEVGPAVATTRLPVQRSDAEQMLPDRPAPGSAERAAADPDELELAIPLPLDEAPTVPRPLAPQSETVARKASPTEGLLGDSSPGALATGTATEASRFTRSSTSRSMPSAAGSLVRPERPSKDARDLAATAGQSLGASSDLDPQPNLIRPPPLANHPAAAPTGAADTYQLRRIDGRREIALKNGGSEHSEQAVEQALAWLAKHQEAEGYWDADQHGGGVREVRNTDKDKPTGGTETDTGLTGLAILSFLGAGHTHEEGHYTDNVSRAIRWLIARQRSDGYLGGRATYYDQMYCHGIATYALAEAYGMQTSKEGMPELREAVERGVWYISQTQNNDGGWRYRVGASASDMSMFGWQLMALKSAQLAGIEVPEETRRGMITFLRSRSRGDHGGLAGYKSDEPPTPAMTAEALFCKQMYGLKRTSASSQEAAEYLQKNLPKMSLPDEYYWYYGTLAMFQYGGQPWDRWNASLRDTLIRLQRKSGDAAGSWDPAGPWGSVGGRIYSTTFSVLCLEVYYRFLPLYQVGEE